MPVYWNDQELRPAPLVTINKRPVRFNNGIVNHHEYIFTLFGTIVNVGTSQDSPSAGTEGMEGILEEQYRLRAAFQEDGGRLQIVSPPAGGPSAIDAYCTVDSVDFDRGTWVNRCDYTITLKSRAIENTDDSASDLAETDENWSITENEDGTFTISHFIQAIGALVYGVDGANDPLDAARQWVVDRMYTINDDGTYSRATPLATGDFDPLDFITGVADTTINFWNKSIVENVDPDSYTWSVTESWIYNPDGNTREEWSASIAYGEGDLQRLSITVSGFVSGFAGLNSNQDLRLTNAKNFFFATTEPNIITRLADYVPTGFTVNPQPATKQYSIEPPGIVRYNYTYFASTGTLIPNAIDEVIDVSDSGTTDVFAQIIVPGRTNGPLFQNMSTVTSPQRTVNITATLIPGSGATALAGLRAAYLAKPNTDDIIDAFLPEDGYYYVTADSEQYNPLRRQYSRSVTWVLDPQGSTIEGIPEATRSTE